MKGVVLVLLAGLAGCALPGRKTVSDIPATPQEIAEEQFIAQGLAEGVASVLAPQTFPARLLGAKVKRVHIKAEVDVDMR